MTPPILRCLPLQRRLDGDGLHLGALLSPLPDLPVTGWFCSGLV